MSRARVRARRERFRSGNALFFVTRVASVPTVLPFLEHPVFGATVETACFVGSAALERSSTTNKPSNGRRKRIRRLLTDNAVHICPNRIANVSLDGDPAVTASRWRFPAFAKAGGAAAKSACLWQPDQSFVARQARNTRLRTVQLLLPLAAAWTRDGGRGFGTLCRG